MKEEHFFYAPQAKENPFLPEEELIHAVRVLRLAKGDKIHLMNGMGSFFDAIIVDSSKKFCKFELVNEIKHQRTTQKWIHLALAPTKNIDRTEWFVEKAVEIGVDEISFLNTEFSERKKVNTDRMEKISIAAMKQSRKPFKTIINPLTDFNNFINSVKEEKKFICHCYGSDNQIVLKEKALLRESLSTDDKALVLIGPEGDFSIKEVVIAEKHGFIPVSLGDSRLRTETAALVAVHIMNLFT